MRKKLYSIAGVIVVFFCLANAAIYRSTFPTEHRKNILHNFDRYVLATGDNIIGDVNITGDLTCENIDVNDYITGGLLNISGPDSIYTIIEDSGADIGGGLLYLRTSRDGAASSDDDFCGYFGFQFYDSEDNLTNGADINVQVKDNTHPTEDADVFFREMVGGSLDTVMTFSEGDATFSGSVAVTGAATLGSIASETIGISADPDLMQLAISALTVNGTIAASTGSTFGTLTLADGSITDSGGTIDLDDENLTTGGTVTLDTTNEINFRDTDISLGSTLSDGILDASADTSIRFFYDNADVGDALDGQSLYVYRRAEEGDNYLRLYVNDSQRVTYDTDTSRHRFEVGSAVKFQVESSFIYFHTNAKLPSDSYKFFFGEGADATIHYDGTNFVLNPKAVGTGYLDIQGDAVATGVVSTTKNDDTLGVGATTFAVTSNVMTITGDGGGNTIATITGASSGTLLTLIFVDGNVDITDDDTHAANTVDLSAAFTSADDTTLQLVYDGTSWYETSRSVN